MFKRDLLLKDYGTLTQKEKRRFDLGKNMLKIPILLIIILVYLYIGFQYSFWHPGWLILLIIPVYYQIALLLISQRYSLIYKALSIFLITSIIYLLIGFKYKAWHPTWIIFLIAMIIVWFMAVYNTNYK